MRWRGSCFLDHGAGGSDKDKRSFVGRESAPGFDVVHKRGSREQSTTVVVFVRDS